MYPLKMKPELKSLIWGGTKLREYYNKNCTRNDVGESWEVSAHPEGESRIANGALKGLSLVDAIQNNPGEIAPKDFPFLFKLIDASEDLSIQVHPDDAYVRKYNNGLHGKIEMWYIIDAKPDARIGYGWNQPMTPELVRQAIENDTLDQYIHYIPVSAGQAYFIPAGIVHCLCKGLLVAEIQQNSTMTYRLYDYNRKDKDGNNRQLHIKESLDVVDFSCDTEAKMVTGDNVTLTSCTYFTVEKITGDLYQGNTNGAFEILFFIDGQGEIITAEGAEPFQGGDTFLLPSSLGAYTIKGQCSIMRCIE